MKLHYNSASSRPDEPVSTPLPAATWQWFTLSCEHAEEQPGKIYTGFHRGDALTGLGRIPA